MKLPKLKTLIAIGSSSAIFLSAYAQDNDTIELSPFSVTAAEGYSATSTISGTGLNTPLMNVPMSINVITSEFLEDSLIGDFTEALDYNSSVTQTTRNNLGATRPSSFSIRGFRNRNLLVDGVLGGLYIPAHLIDRIEIVKGPNTLYGQSDPGGLINVITKTPRAVEGGTFSINVGTNERVGGKLDYTIRAMNDKLGLRILTDYKDHEGWRWVDGQETTFLGVSGTYDFTENTQGSFMIGDNNQRGFPTQRATWSFERIPTDLNGDGDFVDTVDGVKEANTRYNNTFIPREYVTSTPGNIFDSDNNFLTMGLRHSFSETHNFQYAYTFHDTHQIVSFREYNTFSPNPDDPGNKIADANNTINQGRARDEVHTMNDIIDFDTGEVRHQLLLGFRKAESISQSRNPRLRAGRAADQAILEDIEARTGKVFRRYLYQDDILNGVRIWEDDVPSPAELRAFGIDPVKQDFTQTDIDTFYVTDNIYFMDDRFNILAGIRHIDFTQRAPLRSGDANDPLEGSDTNFQFGGVYRINPNVSFFANVADAFEPQSSVNPDTGELIGPQTSAAKEVGIKFDGLYDGKLSGSIAAFNIQKDNVVRRDYNPVTFVADQAVTSDESEGIELELFYNPIDNWNIVASYSWIDAVVVGDVATGLRLEGATPHRFTLFTNYTVDGGPLDGLRFGGGLVRAEGPIQQFGNIVNRYVQQDGYTEVNLFMRYPTMIGEQPVTFGVNIDNATDVTYVRSRAALNEARTVLFSASFDL
ncbi:MAG: TonB-dependent siderophore receptor [Opitutales bacterium]|jgi:iron complex outermembrane receptor protein